MENQKYCVYNQTRESFLSLGITVADTTLEHLKDLIEKLTVKVDSGLWMVPYRGIPAARGLFPVDLVYLDEEYRVIQQVESYPTSNLEPLKDEAASALVLPAHTIYSSQTQPGDQLVICVAEEMERRLERLSSSFASPPLATNSVSSRESQPDSGASGPSPSPMRPAVVQPISQKPEETNDAEPKERKAGSLRNWFLNWLAPSDRRKGKRKPLPGVVAYYWTGATPRAYNIGDISLSGLYLLTEERWFPGTMVLMTLQRTDKDGRNIDDSIAVQSKVVRWGNDGVGLVFVLPRGVDVSSGEVLVENGADKKSLEQFLERVNPPAEELRVAQR